MKSLKALEDKYTLIREAVTPPAAPAAPAAPTAPAAPAAPAAPIDPKVLAALNAPDSPLQPKKIEELSKDPAKLQAYAQNELPKIIDGIVAEITKTNPDAIPEILAAAKRNDLKTVQELLAKYSKKATAAPAPAAAAPAAAPVMSTASYIPNSSNTVTEGIVDDVVSGVKKFGDTLSGIFDWFGKHSFLAYGALGAVLAGPIGILALPLLVKALESRGGKGDTSAEARKQKQPIRLKMAIPPEVYNELKELLTNKDLAAYNKTKYIGLNSAADFKLDAAERKFLDEGGTIVVTSDPIDPDGTPSVYSLTAFESIIKIKVITAGSDYPKPIPATTYVPAASATTYVPAASATTDVPAASAAPVAAKVTATAAAAAAAQAAATAAEAKAATTKAAADAAPADPAAAAAATAAEAEAVAARAKAAEAAKAAKAADEEKMLGFSSYTPFTSLANKVLKEFYKNSKPLPIEIANKK